MLAAEKLGAANERTQQEKTEVHRRSTEGVHRRHRIALIKKTIVLVFDNSLLVTEDSREKDTLPSTRRTIQNKISLCICSLSIDFLLPSFS